MSAFRIPTSISLIRLLVILNLLTLTPISILSLQTPTTTTTTGNPSFDPQITLLGKAKFSSNGSLVLLTSPSPSTSGLLLYKEPFKFPFISPKMTSFSTDFAFSFTGNENRLFLIMGPRNFAAKFLDQGPIAVLREKDHVGIAFFALKDGYVGEFGSNIIHLDVGNVSSSSINGEKLKSWVDYDVGSKKLEIRLTRLGEKRPQDPVLVSPVDLSVIWPGNEVYVALGSFNGNLSETCSVYSWRFRLGKVRSWMHSLPADPHGYLDKDNDVLRGYKRSFCPVTVLAGMMVATICGALLAVLVLNVWAAFVNKNMVLPVEGIAQPAKFRYKPISVVVDEDPKVVYQN